MADGFEISPTVVSQLKELWRQWGSRRTGSLATDYGAEYVASPDMRYEGKLTSSLGAGSLTSPSTATFQAWSAVDPHSPSQGIEERLEIGEITIYNHDAEFVLSDDRYCRIEFLNGCWQVYYGCDA